jgi:hypothetical protein
VVEYSLVVALVASLISAAAFARRCKWSALDTFALVSIPAAWVVTFYVSKAIIWSSTRGKALFFTYGWDKGLANFCIEFAGTGCLLASFFLVRSFSSWDTSRVARLLKVLIVVAAGIALLVPPLGE